MTVDDMGLMLPCPFCGAKPMQWCSRRRSGARYRHLHSRRTDPARALVDKGFEMGADWVLDLLLSSQNTTLKRMMADRRRRLQKGEAA